MLAVASQLVFAFFVLAWAGTVVAVARDARGRLENRGGRRAGVALATLLPFVGALVWLCVRPAETRRDRRERRLRTAVLQRELMPPVLAPPAARAEPKAARVAA